MPVSLLLTGTKPFFLLQSQALLCAPGSPCGKTLVERCALVPPLRCPWSRELAGGSARTPLRDGVGWLVTKAECGGTRGGCLLKGSLLKTFCCLPRSALPPAHPRFTRTFMQVPLWGKAQPFGVTAIALWSFACLGRGASQAPMKKAWKWQVLQEFCSRSRWFGEDLATRAPA